MTRKEIIDGLKMTMGLITFDPSTGEDIDPDDLNDLNRTTYDACKGAVELLEAQERKYTFGNDEFNLESAYHDCKLVFDGITDDDSFQEADTGLILYYANEIIYALHEALKGKDTNVPSNDTISRQATITEIKNYERDSTAPIDYVKIVEQMPPAQPDARYINANELIKRLQQAGLDDAVSIAVKMAGHERLKHVPSAQPKPDKNPLPEQPDSDRLGVKTGETCTDTISRQEAIKVVRKWFDKIKLNGDICIDGIISLPSAQPERLTGHWIYVGDGYADYCKCSKCGNLSDYEENFCCECGADMRGEQDE